MISAHEFFWTTKAILEFETEVAEKPLTFPLKIPTLWDVLVTIINLKL